PLLISRTRAKAAVSDVTPAAKCSPATPFAPPMSTSLAQHLLNRGDGAWMPLRSSRRRSCSIEHIGSAHDEAALAALKAAAAQRLVAGQAELDLGVTTPSASEPLPITCSRAAHLWDALCRSYDVLGFDQGAC